MRLQNLKYFHQITPSGPLIQVLKSFQICNRAYEDNRYLNEKIFIQQCRQVKAGIINTCSRRSRRGRVQEDKRMAYIYTHGLFIT